MNIIERLRGLILAGNDAGIERIDRRLFLRGMAVTGVGLIVGVPTIVVPRPAVSSLEYGVRWRPLLRLYQEESLAQLLVEHSNYAPLPISEWLPKGQAWAW